MTFGRMEGELVRIKNWLAMSAVRAMERNVFGNRGLSQTAKMEVYNTIVVSMLTYRCESWVLREKEKSRLQATEMRVLRGGGGGVGGMSRIDRIRNDEIRHRL